MLQAGSGDGQVHNIDACKLQNPAFNFEQQLKFQLLLSKESSQGKSIKMNLKTPKILQKSDL